MDRDPLDQAGVTEVPSAPVTITDGVSRSRSNPPRSGGGRLVNLALGGALVLAIAGVAFAVGRMTAPATVTGAFPGSIGGQVPLPSGGAFPGGGNRPGGVPGGLLGARGATVEGTVESMTPTTLTLTMADGQTIQIALDEATAYHAQTDAAAQDVTPGAKVLVRLDLGGQGGAGNGTGSSASDVTVVP